MLDILFVLASKPLLMLFGDGIVEKGRLTLPTDAEINGIARLNDNSRRLSTLGMHSTLPAQRCPRFSPLKNPTTCCDSCSVEVFSTGFNRAAGAYVSQGRLGGIFTTRTKMTGRGGGLAQIDLADWLTYPRSAIGDCL